MIPILLIKKNMNIPPRINELFFSYIADFPRQ